MNQYARPLGPRAVHGSSCGALLFGLFGVLLSGNVAAGAVTPEEGSGSISIASRYSHVQYHLSSTGKKLDIGSINESSLLFRLDYGLTDQLALFATLPYSQRQYTGSHPHMITDGHGGVRVSHEDNGHYHGSLQDFSLGVQYQQNWHGLVITPFVSYSTPTHNYPHFAHAAIGAQQKEFMIGVDTATVLPAPLDRFYVQLGIDYAWYEKYAAVHLGRLGVTLETGFAATDRLQLRVFSIGQKTYGGLEFPRDYLPIDSNLHLFWHHDQTQRVDYVDVGAGASYSLDGRTDLFFQYLQTQWGENGHATDYLFSGGITRSF